MSLEVFIPPHLENNNNNNKFNSRDKIVEEKKINKGDVETIHKIKKDGNEYSYNPDNDTYEIVIDKKINDSDFTYLTDSDQEEKFMDSKINDKADELFGENKKVVKESESYNNMFDSPSLDVEYDKTRFLLTDENKTKVTDGYYYNPLDKSSMTSVGDVADKIVKKILPTNYLKSSIKKDLYNAYTPFLYDKIPKAEKLLEGTGIDRKYEEKIVKYNHKSGKGLEIESVKNLYNDLFKKDFSLSNVSEAVLKAYVEAALIKRDISMSGKIDKIHFEPIDHLDVSVPISGSKAIIASYNYKYGNHQRIDEIKKAQLFRGELDRIDEVEKESEILERTERRNIDQYNLEQMDNGYFVIRKIISDKKTLSSWISNERDDKNRSEVLAEYDRRMKILDNEEKEIIEKIISFRKQNDLTFKDSNEIIFEALAMSNEEMKKKEEFYKKMDEYNKEIYSYLLKLWDTMDGKTVKGEGDEKISEEEIREHLSAVVKDVQEIREDMGYNIKDKTSIIINARNKENKNKT